MVRDGVIVWEKEAHEGKKPSQKAAADFVMCKHDKTLDFANFLSFDATFRIDFLLHSISWTSIDDGRRQTSSWQKSASR